MGNGKYRAVTARFQPCCGKMLAKINLSLDSVRYLHRLLGASPFLVLLSSDPPTQAINISMTDWDVWGRAVKSVPGIARDRCKMFAELEMLNHVTGSLNVFWEGVYESLNQQTNPAFAISFIRRYTSTVSTDEDKMAQALFNECSTDMSNVRAVFMELKKNHSSDSDDVAELYINMVKARGGPVRNALQTDRRLLALLIRILDDGVTFSGEKACIRFLKSL